ncbi:unnamed protein product [Discosporangium mesarthrocarpum]
MVDWQPGASPENLKRRARLLSDIRNFFAERDILEVETPALGRHAVTDVHLDSFSVDAGTAGDASTSNSLQKYLQTSPEYAMKRLLAAGSGPIYQLGKAFRREATSRLHNPEFTLLEWYRPGYSWRQLMEEVAALVVTVLELPGPGSIAQFSYAELFANHFNINPHTVDGTTLEALTRATVDLTATGLSATDCLQLLMHHCIEPTLPDYCFVYDYPEAQAALSVVEHGADGIPVARRFELYGAGMELANGYQELTDAQEQRRRFEHDQAQRRQRDGSPISIDERLLAALESGLPACAGVALGVDRLAMLALNANHINEVIAFTDENA